MLSTIHLFEKRLYCVYLRNRKIVSCCRTVSLVARHISYFQRAAKGPRPAPANIIYFHTCPVRNNRSTVLPSHLDEIRGAPGTLADDEPERAVAPGELATEVADELIHQRDVGISDVRRTPVCDTRP
jgi:hypothetical protein